MISETVIPDFLDSIFNRLIYTGDMLTITLFVIGILSIKIIRQPLKTYRMLFLPFLIFSFLILLFIYHHPLSLKKKTPSRVGLGSTKEVVVQHNLYIPDLSESQWFFVRNNPNRFNRLCESKK
jgi:hypothetical protein